MNLSVIPDTCWFLNNVGDWLTEHGHIEYILTPGELASAQMHQ